MKVPPLTWNAIPDLNIHCTIGLRRRSRADFQLDNIVDDALLGA